MASHIAELALHRGLLDSPEEAEAATYAELCKRLFADDVRALLAQAAVQDHVSLTSLVRLQKIPGDERRSYAIPSLETPDAPTVLNQALARRDVVPGEIHELRRERRAYSCDSCPLTYVGHGTHFPAALDCLACGGSAHVSIASAHLDDEHATQTASSPSEPRGDLNNLVGFRLGEWELESLLGAGGLGAVYRAKAADGRAAAVKVILPRTGAQKQRAALRFKREAEITRSLEHEGIVEALGYGEEPFPYLALELVGDTLSAHVSERGRLPVRRVVDLARGIVEALAYAHGKGVIHRDLKPDNILLRDGKPVIADFGLGRDEEDDRSTRLTVTGQAMGTPHYMAPEQINDSKRSGAAADLYAVGAIVFRLLAGQSPFTGPAAKAFMSHFKSDVPDVRMWAPEAPTALHELICALMAKQPEGRPDSLETLSRLDKVRARLGPLKLTPPKDLGSLEGWKLTRPLRWSGAGEAFACMGPQGQPGTVCLVPTDAPAEDVARFRAQGSLLTRIAAPTLARLLHVGYVTRGREQRISVVTARPGPDLTEVLAGHGSVPPAQAVAVALGAARGLASAHAAGLVHEGIKPESLLLVSKSFTAAAVRVSGFGVGFPPLDDGGATARLGAPPFTVSPEQTTGDEVGPATDVYSLGATLFWLLTGSTLFAGSPLSTLLVSHATTLPDRADHRDARVPRTLALVVDLLLLKRPEDRPSMAEVAQLLEAWAREQFDYEDVKSVEARVVAGRAPFERGSLGA